MTKPLAAISRCRRLALATTLVLAAQGVPPGVDAAPPAGPPVAETGGGPVVLDRQSFHRGHVTIEIPRLEARGTSLTDQELRDILDPASSLTANQRLARLSAASISIPAIVVRPDPKPGEPQDQVITLHDILLSDVRAGKAATVSIRSVDGAIRSSPQERDLVSVGAIVAHAVDPTLALTIATSQRTDHSLPILPIYEDVSAAGLTFKAGDDLTFAADRLESGAFEGRPLLESPERLEALSDKAIAGTESAERSRFYAVLLDAAASFRLDRFQLSGLSIEDRAQHAFTLKLRSIAFRGLEALKLALLRVDDVALDVHGTQVSLRSATVSNLDRGALYGAVLSQVMGLAVPAAGPLSGDNTGQTEFKLDALHVAIAAGADTPFPPGTVNIIDVPALESGEGVSKGGTEIENHAHVEVRYDLPPGETDADLQVFRDAGLSHLDVTFDYRLAYDTTARELRLDEVALDAKGLGGITLSGGVGDMPSSPFAMRGTGDERIKAFAQATFRDFRVRATDRGIIGSALPVIARRSGTAPATFKAGLKTQVDLQLPALLGQTPDEAKVAAAIDSLLDAPGTLVLAFHAPRGIPFQDFADADDPSVLLRRLDVTAETRH